MKKNLLLSLSLVLGVALLQAQPFYLRSTTGQCDFGNSNASCELSDVGGGVYELVTDFGGGAVGFNEFKIYDAGADAWYPGGANAWFNHLGGNVTFRFNTGTQQVEAAESVLFDICAPGELAVPNWTNNIPPMVDMGGGQWCYTIANAGSYQWKPTNCGTWGSWEPSTGERSMNSSNFFIQTNAANEQVCVTYDANTGRVSSSTPPPTGYYLRGTAGPCGWNDVSPQCELTDPDNDGIYELSFDFGATPIGRQEFKIYHAATGNYYPGGDNAWYDHQGGAVTFRFNSNTNQVQATEGYGLTICAPGAFSGWDNSASMVNNGGNLFCYVIPNAGTYEWKPTFCGRWDSWQPGSGERSTNAGNWSITTTQPNTEFCVTYDVATGQVSEAQVFAVPTMGQWAMIIFTLLMVAMGMVIVRQNQMTLAGAGTQGFNFSLRQLPFDKAVFNKALMLCGLVMVALFAVAITFFGYEMTSADVPGSLLSLPLAAYIVVLLKKGE
jgi:hypothetical protein